MIAMFNFLSTPRVMEFTNYIRVEVFDFSYQIQLGFLFSEG